MSAKVRRKAANNVGLICKKYFLEVLKKETSTDTYEEYDNSAEEVVDAIRKESSDIGIPVEKTYKDLPLIYATIKMHKNPTKFRFIIGSRTGIIKPAAKKLVQILKLVMKTHRRYCDKVRFFTGIERYWIVENNNKILQNMEKISNRNAARNIKICDFSTLYTKIPPTDLKEKLKEVVGKAFKGGTNQFIRVNKKDAHWDNCRDGQTFSKEHIFLLIDLVVDNSFFRFGDKVFRQKIGIPMGVDPAPQMANLYLYYYEAAYMETLAKQDYGKAMKFNNTSRFIDDLGTLNNDGILASEKERIYPVELVLNEENQDDNHATFLDIQVDIEGKKFKTKTYDKREDYKFEIVNYPDLSGNIPHGAAYGVYTSQIIRYGRVCSRTEDFIVRVKLLTKKLIRKGFIISRLKNTMKKCLGKHNWITRKYEKLSMNKLYQ